MGNDCCETRPIQTRTERAASMQMNEANRYHVFRLSPSRQVVVDIMDGKYFKSRLLSEDGLSDYSIITQLNTIYFVGGIDGKEKVASGILLKGVIPEIIDGKKIILTQLKSMKYPRACAALLMDPIGQFLFAIGGRDEEKCKLTFFEQYSVVGDAWLKLPSMNEPHSNAIMLSNCIYAFTDLYTMGQYEKYDFSVISSKQAWVRSVMVTSNLKSISYFGVSCIPSSPNEVLIMGGQITTDSGSLNVNSVSKLNLETGVAQWATELNLPTEVSFFDPGLNLEDRYVNVTTEGRLAIRKGHVWNFEYLDLSFEPLIFAMSDSLEESTEL